MEALDQVIVGSTKDHLVHSLHFWRVGHICEVPLLIP